MATVSAIYGSGIYGSSEYGEINVTASVTGVNATALTRTLHINAFEVDITEPLYGPDALTVSTNTTIVNIAEKVSGVIGTFTLNAAGLSIRSINRVPVTGSPMTGTIGTLSPNVDEPIATGVEATGQAGTVQVNTAAGVTGVVGTFSVNTVTATGTANTTLTGVEGIGQVGEVEDQPLERIATGVQATGAIGSLTLHTTAGVDGVIGTFTVGTPTVTGVITTFTASAYDRRNVVNTLPKQTSSQRRAA